MSEAGPSGIPPADDTNQEHVRPGRVSTSVPSRRGRGCFLFPRSGRRIEGLCPRLPARETDRFQTGDTSRFGGSGACPQSFWPFHPDL